MRRALRSWPAVVAISALAAVGLVACGGGGRAAESPPTAPGAASSGGAASHSAIPDVEVIDAASGRDFALGSIVPSDRPVLVWFWAPH